MDTIQTPLGRFDKQVLLNYGAVLIWRARGGLGA